MLYYKFRIVVITVIKLDYNINHNWLYIKIFEYMIIYIFYKLTIKIITKWLLAIMKW